MAEVKKIVDAGLFIKALTQGDVLLAMIPKNQVKTLSIVRGSVVKIPYGNGCGCDGGCNDLYVDYNTLVEPETYDPNELLDTLNTMLSSGTSAGGGGSIDTSALQALVTQTNVQLTNIRSFLGTQPLALEGTQVDIRDNTSTINAQVNVIKTLLENWDHGTTDLEALITQTNQLIDAFKTAYTTLTPANHATVISYLNAIESALQDVVNQDSAIEVAMVNGNAALGVKLDNLLAGLNSLKVSYENNFSIFQTNYNTVSSALQNAVNTLNTVLSQVGTYVQEVKTAVDTAVVKLDNIETAQSELSEIKAKLSSIEQLYVLSQAQRIDQSEAGIIYRGYTLSPAALNPEPVWAISKESTDAGVTSVRWVNGLRTFSFTWDARATYTYI